MADSVENTTVEGTSGVEETSPDSLKNTPYNIARLEDVIEHCKGRQKYLAHTRSPSDGGDVRWYFCKVPLAENDLAASIPRTEIVGKSDYFRFGMRDSLAIEASFLQREEELLSGWWKEYAECCEGPRGRSSSGKMLDMGEDSSSSKGFQSAQLYAFEEERVGVPVKGGLYEVDLVKRHCFPVYWNGENRRVLRGHWFARKGGLDWLPLREDVAEQLEIAYCSQVWHRRTFQPSGLFAARVDLQGSNPGLHALFTGEDDTWEAWLNVDASGFSSVFNFTGNGIKLRRGYSASHSPKPTQVPVRHLVFMVHGIGQRLEKSNLVDDVGNFRHITSSLAELHLTSHQRGAQRVLFIPCQWRKGLKLSGEAAVEKITLDGVRGLRVMLSATVHDVLYYMSPIYCQSIIDSVSNQLNRLYLKFLKRNPGYDGKVSIYGHSLGSVVSYDILCHQENLSSPFPMEWVYEKHSKNVGYSPNMNNQSSKCCSLANLEEKNSTTMMKNTVDCIGEDMMVSRPISLVIEKVHVGDRSLVSAENNVAAEDSMQKSCKEDVHDLLNDFSETPQLKEGGFGEATDIAGLLEKVTGEESEEARDKDKAIKMLREEIDSLKAKIAELESHNSEETSEDKETLMQKPPTLQKFDQKLPSKLDDAPKSYTPYIRYTKLEFKVDTFFAVGSPLGVFLALRNIRIGLGKGQEYWDEENIHEEMPACRQMFNIFHPFDPVAYRVEPLVCKEYITKRPVIIPYHKGGRRLHIGFQEFTEDLAARSQAVMDHLSSVRVGSIPSRVNSLFFVTCTSFVWFHCSDYHEKQTSQKFLSSRFHPSANAMAKVLTVCQSRNTDGQEGPENVEEKEERSYGSLMIKRLTGSEEGRIDHMLQDKTFEHPYLQAIGSHTNYWRDYDTALFILKHLYRDIPEDPNSPVESNRGSSKDESVSKGWSDQRETTDEELPLTFSDRIMVRNFSRKAKKFIKKS
ncbi:phospholipase SGR2 isoform X4 [Durio zibethinus]|uniref:Phospholipase SGR2 isoform X4 n=1 Tax=Durio zibethinus TaxID=66656 RepID=A0A6P5WQL0_DURZI|nr:phospholipase SGR2 isoform X4 [Durio zibethinus]